MRVQTNWVTKWSIDWLISEWVLLIGWFTGDWSLAWVVGCLLQCWSGGTGRSRGAWYSTCMLWWRWSVGRNCRSNQIIWTQKLPDLWSGAWRVWVCYGHLLTLKVLVATIDAHWEGMGDVGSARYELALLPPCPTIRFLNPHFGGPSLPPLFV